ncbi:MAG: hypothetical protein IKU71_02320 [Kiritimatiellae bacterium]|nr:hypothetical protein [Kiritimatiellia bacterium]
MKTRYGIIPAAGVAFAAFASHGITLPVCEVAERTQKEVSTYPGRVVPIAQVDVTPQVSGEILEVCFANGDGPCKFLFDDIAYSSKEGKDD